MFSLRHKLIVGFASLFAVAVIVSAVGIGVINTYSQALQKVLRENYDSIVYCREMQASLQRIHIELTEGTLSSAPLASAALDSALRHFERNLALERGNITLPGESEAVNLLTQQWEFLKPLVTRFDASPAAADRDRLYRADLMPLLEQLNRSAQQISDMNLSNMIAVDGQAQQQAQEAKKVTYLLVVAGLLLALALIVVTGRSILQPLRLLTHSIREIQQGNLNLVLHPRYRDEVGQLMEAFNDMAAELREYKRGAQAKLARSQQSAQLVLDSLPDAVIIMLPDATVELANDAARRILGVHPGGSIYDVSESWLRSVKLNEPAGAPESATSPPKIIQSFVDGKEHFFLPRVLPVRGQDGSMYGLILTFMDVTRLRRISEMEKDLVSTVSHEIKTPLTSVRMALHLTLDERVGQLNPQQLELLTTARDDAERLYAIVNDLLEMARVEASHESLTLTPALPLDLVESAVHSMHTAYQHAGVEIVTNVPAELPEVMVNEPRIASVIGNVLSNALKFSSPGSRVEIEAASVGEFVQFQVRDHGSGIAPDDLPHIFERFYRGRSDRSTEGAGLGLAIAHEIVEAHGGAIRAISKPGAGTTIEFTLRQATPAI